MTDSFIIKIDWEYFLGLVGALIAIAWYSSGRFSKIETLLEGVDRRLINLEGGFSGAFQSQSPISLTVKGNQLLNDSGLKKYIDERFDELFTICQNLKKMETAYDIQTATFECFDKASLDFSFETSLKDFAYKGGVDLKILRRVGGIYLRDLVLKKMGRNETEIN